MDPNKVETQNHWLLSDLGDHRENGGSVREEEYPQLAAVAPAWGHMARHSCGPCPAPPGVSID